VLTAIFCVEVSQAQQPDLVITDLLLSQTRLEPGITPHVDVSFVVRNNGGATDQPFDTIISGLGNPVTIRTTPADGHPSADAGESIYFSQTFNAPPSGQFTVTVALGNNNEVSQTSNIESPPVGHWYSLGPRIMEWPDGASSTGRLTQLVLTPGDPSTIYVHGEQPGSGIWRTTDGGNSWVSISRSISFSNENGALAVDPQNTSRVYLLTTSGLLRSDNRGTSWREISNFTNGADVSTPPFRINPSAPRVMYFGQRDGIYSSLDGGRTWQVFFQQIGSDGSPARVRDLILQPNAPDTMVATLEHSDPDVAGVWRTTKGSASMASDWIRIGDCSEGPLPSLVNNTIRVATSGNTIYVETEAAEAAIYRSTGTCSNGTDFIFKKTGWTLLPRGGYFGGLYVDPGDPRHVYLQGVDFFYSSDGGESFSSNAGGHADHKDLAIDPATPSNLYQVNDGGIHKSIDRGRNWTFIGEGIINGEFYGIAPAEGDPEVIVGGTQDNGNPRYKGPSLAWQVIDTGDGALADVDAFDASISYVTSQYPFQLQRAKFTTKGDFIGCREFNRDGSCQVGCGLPIGFVCQGFHFQIDPTSANTLFASCGSLFRGVDVACQATPPRQWQAVFNPPTGNVVRSQIDPAAEVYYAATDQGSVFATTKAKLTDASSWTRLFDVVPAASISDVEVDPNDAATVFVSTNSSAAGRIFELQRAVSEGRVSLVSSADITSNLPANLIVTTLAVDRNFRHTIYAGTQSGGIYQGVSLDNGMTWSWSPYQQGMHPRLMVTELAVHPTTGILRAATYGGGVFEVATDFPIGSLVNLTGRIILLRVNEVGDRFGTPSDDISAEVIVQLDSRPDLAFGLQLRRDTNLLERRAAFNSLKTAFKQDMSIAIDYRRTSLHTGAIVRVFLIK
jgi:photosystem II stability/assembly factor-like uncharacterized protein